MADKDRKIERQADPTGEARLGSGYGAGRKEIVSLVPPPDSAGIGTPVASAGGEKSTSRTNEDSPQKAR